MQTTPLLVSDGQPLASGRDRRGRFAAGNLAAFRHGLRSRQVQGGELAEQADAVAALAERQQALEAGLRSPEAACVKKSCIRKVCGCARRTWAKCPYPWHFNFTWKGTPYRFSLDRHIGRQVSERAEAEAEADKLRAAIRDGSFCAVPTPPVPPPSTPEDVTFAKLGELWLERARDGQVTSAKTDRSMIAKLSPTPLEDGVTLGTRSVGRVTPDDLAVALRALKSAGRSASTRNKYLQTLKSSQKWGRRNHYLTRVWLDEDFELRRERRARRDRRLEPDVVNEKGVLIREGEELRRLDLHFHDLRHEAGSRLLECGWPIHHAQQMLGHADLKQTADYLNVTRMGLSDSMRRFGTAAAMQTDANATATEHPPTGTAALPPAPQVTIN